MYKAPFTSSLRSCGGVSGRPPSVLTLPLLWQSSSQTAALLQHQNLPSTDTCCTSPPYFDAHRLRSIHSPPSPLLAPPREVSSARRPGQRAHAHT
ncbi:uncharacterized protein CC84DRAFT_1164133 [Paraphaeosphaeria sporulosa]|uniref:Uncharacterized protein n=1 Tax=Paraphaeosphaeria sporulosa TaxID=1460663 RepID=A0A177CFZ7_9PLEO|nr:uncharacterized protein CC84DRAFT_1164133 [Paraphaeosphaeria sporulosa]OAG05660.1 hypothetical protein CC84DRAFT_1164133 [Paraphaeosphaeria sporulosa]